MKFYITFGQGHAHSVNDKTFDKDCVCTYECKDQADGDRIAWEMFDGVFHEHSTKMPPMEYYPRGLINLEQFVD